MQNGLILGQRAVRVPNGDAVIGAITIVTDGQEIGVRFVPGQADAGAGLFGRYFVFSLDKIICGLLYECKTLTELYVVFGGRYEIAESHFAIGQADGQLQFGPAAEGWSDASNVLVTVFGGQQNGAGRIRDAQIDICQ